MVYRPLELTPLLLLCACVAPELPLESPAQPVALTAPKPRAVVPLGPASAALDPGWSIDAPAGRIRSQSIDLQALVGVDGAVLGGVDGDERITLRLSGWGRGETSVPDAGRRDGLTVHHGDFRQWWSTRDGFLEFGFVVESASDPGDLIVDLSGGRSRVDDDQATLIGVDGDEIDLHGLAAWDATGRALQASFEPLPDGLRLRVDVGDAVFPVSIDPLLDSPSWTAQGDGGSRFGAAVVQGDWNGDGLTDLAIGAPRSSISRWREGAVHVFWGDPAGMPADADVILEGGRRNARFGEALASGDLDGDGLDDLVVGAPGWSAPQIEEGAVFAYSGGGLAPIFSWQGDRAFAQAGRAVAVGDFGVGSLVVGAPGWSDAAFWEGAVFAWADLTGGPDWSWTGGAALARTGRSVAVGDVNGDGLGDLVFGAPGWRQTLRAEGAVRVVAGDTAGLGDVLWSAFGSQRGAGLGQSVGAVDGRVLAGAPGWNGEAVDEGAAFGWADLGAMPSWSLRSGQGGARLGGAVAGAGDLNGDGWADLLLGAERWDGAAHNAGAAFAVLGSAAGFAPDAHWSAEGAQAHEHFGKALSAAGDQDGDGFDDALIGSPDWDGAAWNQGQVARFSGTWTDADGDGDPSHVDCDDNDPSINTLDLDLDGYEGCSAPVDCDDSTPQVAPGSPESCDGVDNDCDGLVDGDDGDFDPDADADGFFTEGCGVGGDDCDDNDGHVFPDARQGSGPISLCAPAVHPGFASQWHHARLSEANPFIDPVSGEHFLYFRGSALQAEQAIGVAASLDGVDWEEPVGPILPPGPPGAWDEWNTSNPAVVHLEGLLRPYVMLYHGRDPATGTRAVGLASALDPMGPFERLSPVDGAPLVGPVLPPSSDPAFGDSFIVLHPAVWLDADSGLLHLWYNGRSAADSTLRIFHATSADSGLSWTRSDVDGVPGPDVVWQPSELWHDGRVTQPSVLPDPEQPDQLLLWFTGGQEAIGAASGTPTEWQALQDGPAFAASPDCRRFDGAAVTARGVQHDPVDDVFHWYYTAQTDLVACPANTDPWYDTPWGVVSYVGHAVNHAPVVGLDDAEAGALEGTVADTGPGGVIITATSDLDGYLGAATVAPAVGSGVLETTWALVIDPPLSPGLHTVSVQAIDEGGVVRSVEVSIDVP